MLALVLGDRPHLEADHPAPERPPGEARVAMRLAGVCDTDLQLTRGHGQSLAMTSIGSGGAPPNSGSQ